MRLRQRLRALETSGNNGLPHVVLWSVNESFEECLSRSAKNDSATSHLLIELAFVGEEPLTPEQLAEQAKAYAWAEQLEAA